MRWVWAETSGKDRLPERVAAKGRLIRCTIPGSTPNYLAMTRTLGRPGAVRASRIRFSSTGAIGGARGLYPLPFTLYPLPFTLYPLPLPFTLYPLLFTLYSLPLTFTFTLYLYLYLYLTFIFTFTFTLSLTFYPFPSPSPAQA